MVLSSILLASSQDSARQKRTAYGGISVGAKVSASAGVYNDVQRPLPVVASPYTRPYSTAVIPPYPVTRTVLVSVPQPVAVPVARPYRTVPVPAGQPIVAGTVIPGYYQNPYYYPVYAGYGGAGAIYG